MRVKLIITAILLLFCTQFQKPSTVYANSNIVGAEKSYGSSIFKGYSRLRNKMRNWGSIFAAQWHGKIGVITAWHMIRDSEDYKFIVGDRVFGPFIQINSADMAWCETSLPVGWKALITIYKDDYLNNDCWAIGWPDTIGYPRGLEAYSGKVVGETKNSDFVGGKYLIVNGTAVPGMSGGPIINKDGEVFGIISYTNAWYTQHYPLAIPK